MLDLSTAVLWEGPIADAAADPDLAGEYGTEQGQSWTIRMADDLLVLESGPGRFIPLFPIGADRLFSGFGSVLLPVRGPDGRIVAIDRYFGDRLAWRANRRGWRPHSASLVDIASR